MTPNNIPLSRPLVFFDLETTGINLSKDRIVEISLVKAEKDFSRTVSLTRRVNPTIPIPPEVSRIHGIYDHHVKDAPTFKDIAVEILQFIEGCDLGGFNCVHFDIPLLAEELLRAGTDFDLTNRRVIDVQKIFHLMEPRDLKAALRFYCQKELENAHSAEADAKATLEVFLAQANQYRNRKPEPVFKPSDDSFMENIEQLHGISGIAKKIDLGGVIVLDKNGVEVINLGKYKGTPLKTLIETNPGYIDWILRSDFPLTTKKILRERMKG
ncbi:MAG: DNA polymerase III subunit epsilon [Bacteroidetes bacterium RIFCSPLOWO2_02_FULL_36_8]|nr:MAG: DNA polymerase III subunit epsilon [Bacteroidetes bacterium RIFCSPLOWO2_02_FULL_36_8]OFY70392.1 MAG: DNA polymerase III subunit epsilon [Bacteroidetes bacterium RIFCSPLOWO2_12_FULL_37_12]